MDYQESLKIKEYFVVEDDAGADVFIEFFPTKEEAIKAAERGWWQLTRIERRNRTISAMSVTQKEVNPDNVDEDKPWWEATVDRMDVLVKFPVQVDVLHGGKTYAKLASGTEFWGDDEEDIIGQLTAYGVSEDAIFFI